MGRLSWSNYASTIPFATKRLLCRDVTKRRTKIFREVENAYFHQVMERLPAYRQSVLAKPTHDNIWSMLSGEESCWPFDDFRHVSLESRLRDIESEMHSKLIRDVSEKVHLASTNQLKDCLLCLSLWPLTASTRTANFMRLWNALDRECTRRASDWTPDTQLLLADCFFHLSLNRITSYNRTVLRNLAKSLAQLPVSNVVHYLFLTNLQRWMTDEAYQILDHRLPVLIPEINLEEIGIVCQALFKCQKPIQDVRLLQQVTQRTIKQLPDISSLAMCAIVKQIRYSSTKYEDVHLWKKLLDACEPYIKYWHTSTVVHLYDMASSLRIFDPGFLIAAKKYLASNLNQLRLKEIAKLMAGTAMFGLGDAALLEAVTVQLRSPERGPEIQRYHPWLVSCVWHLVLQGFYQEDLIRLALDEDSIDLKDSHAHVTFELYAIRCSVLVERPGYKGLTEHMWTVTSRLERSTWLASQICARLEGIAVDVVFLLPHMAGPDIVFGFDLETQMVQKAKLETLSHGIKRPCQGSTVCAIVVQGRSCFCHTSRRLNGLASAKVRQLRRLGFVVLQVPYYDVTKLSVANLWHWLPSL